MEGSHVEGPRVELKDRLRQFGVGQDDIAARCNVTRVYVGMILNGKRRLTERIAAAIDDLCRESASRKLAECEALTRTLLAEATQAGGGHGE